MKRLIALLAVVGLSGCAASGMPTFTADVPDNVSQATHKMTNFLMEGSYVVLNDEWAITVAHNKPIIMTTGRTAIYHDSCDVALVKTRFGNTADTKTGYLYRDDETYASGYPGMYMPLAYNSGKYLGDAVVKTDGGNCQYSFTESALISGMSGGGMWNAKGELVGVNVGIGPYQDDAGVKHGTVGVFITLNGVRDWIYDVTGIKVGE